METTTRFEPMQAIPLPSSAHRMSMGWAVACFPLIGAIIGLCLAALNLLLAQWLPSGVLAALLVAASRGRIDITGAADTPHPCYTLTAELESSVGQLSLRITARAADNAGCVAVIGRFAYSAAIAVRAGTYSLSIIHTYPNTGWPTTEVLKQTITVD